MSFKILLIISAIPVLALADAYQEYEELSNSFSQARTSSDQVHCGLVNYLHLQQLNGQITHESRSGLNQNVLNFRPERQDSVLSPNGHFLMHFNHTGFDSVPAQDTEGNGVPDYVDSAGVYLEKVWDKEINELGFYPPPGADGNPVSVYPIYFTNFGYYGLTTPETIVRYKNVSESAFTSFIELHSNYDGSMFYSQGLEGLKVTAAHEFHHAIQFGYTSDYVDNIFFMEMTSTWMEDYVFDEVNDYIFYLYSLFSSLFSTSFTSTYNYDPYANCLYNHMLEKQYGAGIIKDIWDFIIHENVLDAINHELTNRNSSFAQSQNQYAGWLYFTGRRAMPNVYFPEGSIYPELTPNEGLDALDYGITSKGMRLIRIKAPIDGLAKSTVESARSGKFSHILYGYELTRPLDFNKKAVVAYSKNDSVIIVLSNPNNTVIFDAGYLVESARVITGANPVGVQSGSGHMQFLNVPQNAVIRIYNILGQRIKTLHNGSADQILWNYNDQSGRQIATGIYIFSVEAAAFNFTGKLTILK
jgi:hypothetical protein